MASLNASGIPVVSTRKFVRSLGQGFVVSQDGQEVSTTVANSGALIGTNADIIVTQYSTARIVERNKVYDAATDTTVSLSSGIVI